MTRGRLLGVVLPLLVAQGAFLSVGFAQDDPRIVAPLVPAPMVQPGLPPGGSNYPPLPMPPWVPPGTQPAPPEAPGLRGWLHRHNLACWSHHNSPGCGSLKAECIFIYGSCRDFYGEPCMPRPEPYPPAPPQYSPEGYPLEYGGYPVQKGCGCSW